MKPRNGRTGEEAFKTIYEQTYHLECGPFRIRLLKKEAVELF